MKLFRREREGQVTVELMLILPVLMLMIFFILEYGNIAYHTIIANHASYEFARIGALVAANRPSGKANSGTARNKINAAKLKVFGANADRISVGVKIESTGTDPMYSAHRHEDVVVTVIYPIELAFPGTSWLLASEPKKDGIRKIQATTRMPVEKMYASSDPKK
ncbi:MAG: pilus assembly protein [Elusimicrobiaceae bacterium]|nr:pilus assembly protein [Elusimicrobiaceae bacterium]MBR2504852.1 pilus assembly protein [Elusimicrobiaceae bacterium]MBR5609486.1 pilus assembly protein [Elusimicrobiaceae bacterium]